MTPGKRDGHRRAGGTRPGSVVKIQPDESY